MNAMCNPLVSVIIPAYKCENFISSAIESVLSQTYENIELIVVDDGSPDNTASVTKQYLNRIHYIHQENGGVSKARNTGIRISKGEYVAFLDADDKWENNKLELQMKLFMDHPDVKFVFCSFWNTKNGNVLLDKSFKDAFNFFKEYRYDMDDIFEFSSYYKNGSEKVKYYWGNIYDYLFLGNMILPSSVIVQKDSLLLSGMFNENFKVAEETELFLKYSTRNTIGFIQYPLVYYEVPNVNNLSGKSNLEKLMKNALKIQIDSYIYNRNRQRKNSNFYFKGISKTYCRLAYYYISEYNFRESRRYAVCAIKSCQYNMKAYLIWFISFFPKQFLEYISRLKRMIKREARHNVSNNVCIL
jgi:glycosyltransferase involved in cell wall biosynthesis